MSLVLFFRSLSFLAFLFIHLTAVYTVLNCYFLVTVLYLSMGDAFEYNSDA